MKQFLQSQIPDWLYFQMKYIKYHKKFCKLKSPTSFYEFIFSRMYNPEPVCKTLADRLALRDYASSAGFQEYLVPSLGSIKCLNDIKSTIVDLNRPYVLKMNNSCGQVLVVKPNTKITNEEIERTLKSWWHSEFWKIAREKHYKYIKKGVLIEEFLGDDILDYKMHVFNNPRKGQRYVFQIIRRASNSNDIIQNCFDENWERNDFGIYNYLNINLNISKPERLEEMKEVGRSLLGDLKYARIDFYIIGDQLKLGEITLTPKGGGKIFADKKLEEELSRFTFSH